MMNEILQLLGISDLSGVPPDLQFTVSALFVLFILSEVFRLLRTLLYRIFGGDKW
mgnify:FL=1|jgi:hypothetical protein